MLSDCVKNAQIWLLAGKHFNNGAAATNALLRCSEGGCTMGRARLVVPLLRRLSRAIVYRLATPTHITEHYETPALGADRFLFVCAVFVGSGFILQK